ncbi:nuclear transport factor 2 family protein [Epibacterium sp. Ofav1-8]|uniref:nuclear transport factor 2 family protein n=1 Tax=Epibacterium sp. Ofav1-8 TaxID=2917735 RepID=UPI001EF63A80|nr:nuclear transport factor 2 family protein [Epibacterium sp. Ofav1-8]MCG7625183.1 nuclear transport factor 2 family protein [Epibacterium sp. Ofav1-8]
MNKSEILTYWLNSVWGSGEFESFETLFCKGATIRGAMTRESLEPREIIEFVANFRSLVRSFRAETDMSIEEENWLASRVKMHIMPIDGGDEFVAVDHFFVRFNGSKISEVISHLDYFSFFEGTGQLPKDALAACMTGDRLTWHN